MLWNPGHRDRRDKDGRFMSGQNEQKSLFQKKELRMSHDELVTRAEKWLMGAGKCKFAFTELASYANYEIPDAIGFSFWTSTLIECKTSRADFFSDKKKLFRQMPHLGCGVQRYFLCEKDLISKEELPEGWGLLYVSGKSCRRVKTSEFKWSKEQLATVRYNERYILVSALNRFGIRLNGDFSQIYDIEWNPMRLWVMKVELKGRRGESYWGPI